MTIADATQLTSQEILMFALAGLTLLVIIGRLIQRATTGHIREDFMTPAQVRRTYFPTSEEAEEDAEYVPTPGERRSNRRAWTVAIIGMVIISAIYFASSGGH